MADSINDDLREANKEMAELTRLAAYLATLMQAVVDPVEKGKLVSQFKAANVEAEKLHKTIDALNTAAKNAATQGLAGIGTAIKNSAQSATLGRFYGGQVGGMFGSIGGQIGGIAGAVSGAAEGASKSMAAGGSAGAAALGAAIPIAGAIKEGMNLVVDLFKGAVDYMKSTFNSIVGYVKFSDPGRIQRLDMAFEDLYAAVGSGLTPIIDSAIVVIDQFNRVITEVMSILKPAFSELAEMFKDLAGIALSSLKPVFVEMAGQLRMVISVLKQFTDAVVSIMRQLGMSTSVSGPQSIAARPAQMIGTEAIGEQARLTAFGSRSDLQNNTEATEANTNALQQLNNAMGGASLPAGMGAGAGAIQVGGNGGFSIRPWGGT